MKDSNSKAFALTWYRALTWYSSSLRQTSRYSLPGSKGAPSPRADSFLGFEMRARGTHAKKVPSYKHGTKLGRTLCYTHKNKKIFNTNLVGPTEPRWSRAANWRCARCPPVVLPLPPPACPVLPPLSPKQKGYVYMYIHKYIYIYIYIHTHIHKQLYI